MTTKFNLNDQLFSVDGANIVYEGKVIGIHFTLEKAYYEIDCDGQKCEIKIGSSSEDALENSIEKVVLHHLKYQTCLLLDNLSNSPDNFTRGTTLNKIKSDILTRLI